MRRIYEYEDLQPILEQLLEDKESNDMEFKTAKGGFPHSMWETYSSFANTDGGAIIFGIKEKDNRFYLDGLTREQVKQYEKDFFNGMHNKQVVNIALLKEDDVQAVEFKGSYFLFFYIPRVDRSRKDRKTGEYGLTYAGLLMFGTYSAIMDANPNFFPDYQEIEDPNDRWINRICPDGNWESNLFQFYSRVLPILQNFLPKPFILEGNQRKTETPAHVAVREALTNALVHSDFTVNASLNIYKYPNKMVFSNPGTMLIPIWQFYKGGESVCRNKHLQTMFSFLGSAEKAGSGADKILHGWDDLKWKRPYLMERYRPNKIVLTMPMESLLDNDLKETLQKMFGNKLDALNHNQLMTLALAYSEEEISNERLQYALEMHKADISIMLGKLCKLQLLESSGYGRGTKYHVHGVEVPKTGKVATSDQKVATSDQKVATYKKHYSKEELRELIVEYCTEWRTLDDISVFIGRNRKYLRNKVLPQMTNILEKMYENIPNHPRQKYRAKRKEADT